LYGKEKFLDSKPWKGLLVLKEKKRTLLSWWIMILTWIKVWINVVNFMQSFVLCCDDLNGDLELFLYLKE